MHDVNAHLLLVGQQFGTSGALDRHLRRQNVMMAEIKPKNQKVKYLQTDKQKGFQTDIMIEYI